MSCPRYNKPCNEFMCGSSVDGICKEKPTRKFSDKQEKHIAKITGGRVQSNSGGTKFGGGDVHTDKFFIEAKTPTKFQGSFTIKVDWLKKMMEQMFEQGKDYCALAFRFDPDENVDWYIVNEYEFLEYLQWKESQDVLSKL